jgi:hypothetical protein
VFTDRFKGVNRIGMGERMELRRIPPQGSEVVCSWSLAPATLRPHEMMSVSLEMQLPFILVWILMASTEGLEKLSVVDLLSGDKSLFVSSGTFSAQLFGEKGRGPTFGSRVTKLGEKLVLKVINLSGDEVSFRASVFGRCFNTYEEGILHLRESAT